MKSKHALQLLALLSLFGCNKDNGTPVPSGEVSGTYSLYSFENIGDTDPILGHDFKKTSDSVSCLANNKMNIYADGTKNFYYTELQCVIYFHSK